MRCLLLASNAHVRMGTRLLQCSRVHIHGCLHLAPQQGPGIFSASLSTQECWLFDTPAHVQASHPLL